MIIIFFLLHETITQEYNSYYMKLQLIFTNQITFTHMSKGKKLIVFTQIEKKKLNSHNSLWGLEPMSLQL
ncbi:hypothetical protein WN943_001686 [Citrus x changshan-huyou]